MASDVGSSAVVHSAEGSVAQAPCGTVPGLALRVVAEALCDAFSQCYVDKSLADCLARLLPSVTYLSVSACCHHGWEEDAVLATVSNLIRPGSACLSFCEDPDAAAGQAIRQSTPMHIASCNANNYADLGPAVEYWHCRNFDCIPFSSELTEPTGLQVDGALTAGAVERLADDELVLLHVIAVTMAYYLPRASASLFLELEDAASDSEELELATTAGIATSSGAAAAGGEAGGVAAEVGEGGATSDTTTSSGGFKGTCAPSRPLDRDTDGGASGAVSIAFSDSQGGGGPEDDEEVDAAPPAGAARSHLDTPAAQPQQLQGGADVREFAARMRQQLQGVAFAQAAARRARAARRGASEQLVDAEQQGRGARGRAVVGGSRTAARHGVAEQQGGAATATDASAPGSAALRERAQTAGAGAADADAVGAGPSRETARLQAPASASGVESLGAGEVGAAEPVGLRQRRVGKEAAAGAPDAKEELTTLSPPPGAAASEAAAAGGDGDSVADAARSQEPADCSAATSAAAAASASRSEPPWGADAGSDPPGSEATDQELSSKTANAMRQSQGSGSALLSNAALASPDLQQHPLLLHFMSPAAESAFGVWYGAQARGRDVLMHATLLVAWLCMVLDVEVGDSASVLMLTLMSVVTLLPLAAKLLMHGGVAREPLLVCMQLVAFAMDRWLMFLAGTAAAAKAAEGAVESGGGAWLFSAFRLSGAHHLMLCPLYFQLRACLGLPLGVAMLAANCVVTPALLHAAYGPRDDMQSLIALAVAAWCMPHAMLWLTESFHRRAFVKRRAGAAAQAGAGPLAAATAS